MTDDGYALVLRPGEQLSRRAVSSPSGEFSVVHQHDGNVVVYRNADRYAVWATGTNFQRAVVNPQIVPTDALDRVHGRPGRLVLEQDGDLRVYSSAGDVLWSSHTAGRAVAALMIQDLGRLVLKTAEGTIPWSSGCAPQRWDGWNRVTDGRRLRRGQCLRNASLVSDNGAYCFVMGEGAGAFLCETDGPLLWAVDTGDGEGLELTDDGRLLARAPDGTQRPADALRISPAEAARIAARGAAELLVTDEGRLAIADAAGSILWSLEAPIVRRRLAAPGKPLRAHRPRIPTGVPRLPAGEDVPIIRTDFSDEAAWQDALARVSGEHDSGGDEPMSIDVAAIDDRRYAGLTAAQLAVLAPAEAGWPMLVVADAQTMAAPSRHLLLVNLDEDSLGPTVRATPARTVEIAINLWMGNMDWEDFAGDPDYDTYDPDEILDVWGSAQEER